MTDSFIVDSSTGLAWVLGNQATDATRELLMRQRLGATVVVPWLWYYEIANGLVVGLRRKLLSADDYGAAITFFKSLRITRDDDGIEQALSETSTLSQRYFLSIYDAAYLELALRRKLPLATRDNALASAGRRCGIEIL